MSQTDEPGRNQNVLPMRGELNLSNEKPLPNYPVVPLRQELIRVAAVQSRVRTISLRDAERGKRANLEHMARLIDNAQGWAGGWQGKNDLLVFHEFPISGWDGSWTRNDLVNVVSIDVPGEETAFLGEKAKQYNSYIAFGCYARERDWPDHFINMGVIVAPSGEVILKNWKRCNIPGVGMSTTVYDVLDQYVERYGWDAVFPVARTDIGNIAFLPEPWELEVGTALALNGAEIIIRYMTGGGDPVYRGVLQAQCLSYRTYGVFINQSVSSDNADHIEDVHAGCSGVIDPSGHIIADVMSHHECVATAPIPIASYRKSHGVPPIAKGLFTRLWADYEAKFPPNVFLDRLPKTLAESAVLYHSKARW